MLILLTSDPLITRRVRQLAGEHGLTVAGPPESPPGAASTRGPAAKTDLAGTEPGDAALAGTGVAPVAAVIDVLRPDALDRIRAWRSRWPDALIAGHIGTPDRDLWVAAERAGCDLVASRGALVPQLRDRLAGSFGHRPERFPLLDVADAAGRLGLVCRVDETPAGPLAVYRVAGQWQAIADRCPHAGAVLSAGELEGTVITCPRHGSRFDIRTGERLRGPADTDIEVFPLIQERGQIYLPIRR